MALMYWLRRIPLMLLALLAGCATHFKEVRLERVGLSPDGKRFVLQPSGAAFVPWGFNYDHDEAGRLLEDYWEAEWPKVCEDFREMKQLGANVVRVHLQFGRFMAGESQPRPDALARFAQLL